MIDKLDKYKIESKLGEGAFATVYRAIDTSLKRPVALKILRPQLLTDPAFMQNFLREAQTMARMRHPHIVTVYEAGQADGQLFIAMDLADNGSLDEHLSANGPLAWAEMLATLKPVCDALDYAHTQNTIHRDLKPENILIDKTQGPLLTDFGFAQLMSENSMSMSLSGGIVGTPAYIAPEVWDKDDALHPPADIYALGCIAYEMLTGEMLFKGKTPMRIMRAHDKGAKFNIDKLTHCPTGTVDVLARALAPDPAERIQRAGDLLAQLENLSKPKPAFSKAKREAHTRKLDAETMIWEKDGKEMVRVPAGEFIYGGEYDEDDQEKRTLPEYWIDKTPVTNAEYARFVKASGYKTQGDWKATPDGKANHPVVYVNWHDATAYAEWAGKRLPTEEEWEKAARGTDGRKYPWGNQEPDKSLANYELHEGSTTPVGKYSPQGDSPYGCVDMSGNVWEWCADWYDADKDWRVLRGGSWSNLESNLRAAVRNLVNPDDSLSSYGFRCVLAGSAQN